MATRGRKKQIKANDPIKYIIEDGVIPMSASPIKDTPEYQIMEKMNVNQSVSFPPSKRSAFDYSRNVFHKETLKRFIVRTVHKSLLRVFRIKDATNMGERLKKYTKKQKD